MSTPNASDYLGGAELSTTGEKASWLEAAEKRNAILLLRKRGMTYEEISLALSRRDPPMEVAPSTVRDHVHRYLRRVHEEDAESVEQLRVLENERLDELLIAWGPKARSGDAKAAGIVLRLMERRARMNGLDAAQRVEHTGNVSVLHELGTDPASVEAERQAWITANGGEDPVDVEFTELAAPPAPLDGCRHPGLPCTELCAECSGKVDDPAMSDDEALAVLADHLAGS